MKRSYSALVLAVDATRVGTSAFVKLSIAAMDRTCDFVLAIADDEIQDWSLQIGTRVTLSIEIPRVREVVFE